MNHRLDTKTICLNMIVKNESLVIKRCLSSVKHLINYWVIVDTGSTDDTQKLIKEFLQDIPGELHERPWVDFAHNRNEALFLAKDKADYLLFIDADEELSFIKGFVMPDLNKDFYFGFIKDSIAISKRVILINNRLEGWKWKGVLHEQISNIHMKSCATIEGMTNLAIFNDGNRSRDPNKLQKDIQLLKDGLEKEPQNSDYIFFLAQTYACAKEYDLALKNYEKRSTMNGCEEAVFWSLFMIGQMHEKLKSSNEKLKSSNEKSSNEKLKSSNEKSSNEKLKSSDETINNTYIIHEKSCDEIINNTYIIHEKSCDEIINNSYIKAAEYRPSRVEPIFRLADIACKNRNFMDVYKLVEHGLSLPFSQDSISVMRWIHEYGFLCILSECFFNMEKFQEAYDILQEILKKELPSDIQEQIERNCNIIKSKLNKE